MKMDIEGGEWSLATSLSKHAHSFDIILIELHPRWSSRDDESAMYQCLSHERELLMFDEECRGLRTISSRTEFAENLERYYFLSSIGALAPMLREFHW